MSLAMPRTQYVLKRDTTIAIKKGGRQLALGRIQPRGNGWVIHTATGMDLDRSHISDRGRVIDEFLCFLEAQAMDPWKSWEDFGEWIS